MLSTGISPWRIWQHINNKLACMAALPIASNMAAHMAALPAHAPKRCTNAPKWSKMHQNNATQLARYLQHANKTHCHLLANPLIYNMFLKSF